MVSVSEGAERQTIRRAAAITPEHDARAAPRELDTSVSAPSTLTSTAWPHNLISTGEVSPSPVLMRLRTAVRVIANLFPKGFRQNCGDFSSMTPRLARLMRSSNRTFRHRVVRGTVRLGAGKGALTWVEAGNEPACRGVEEAGFTYHGSLGRRLGRDARWRAIPDVPSLDGGASR